MTSTDRLARRLARVERDIRNGATQPRLAYSALDGGSIKMHDTAGGLTGIIGEQFDGTTSAAVVGGTFPVAPTMPLVTEIVGGLRVYWDGTYVDGSPTRMDFRRVTFHAVTDVDDLDILDPAQIIGEITIATGGEVTVGLPYVEHFVCAVVWTEAGKFSVESDFAFGTPQFVNTGDLDPSIDLGGAGSDGNPPATAPVVTGTAGFQSVHLTWPEVTNADRVFYEIAISDTDGFTPTVGDIEGNITGTMANIVTPYTTAYVKVRALDVDGPGPWSTQVTVVPKQGLNQSDLDTALEGVDDDLAALAASLATTQSDLDTAEATLVTVGSDLDTAEATLATAQGDITTALANAAAANTAAGNAQTTANGAVTLANGKNKVSFSTSTPGTTANTAGDTWFRLDGSGNVIAVYSGTGGTSWVQRAVDGTAIVADSITATQIAANAVTTNELNALAVTAAKIAANTITAAQIAADTITSAQIAADAITTNELAANSVTAAKIVALTITGDKIAANTITADNIAANAITTDELAANSVTAAKIVAATITGDKIAANTITADEIAANTITAAEIASDYVYTGQLQANQIQTGELTATLSILSEIKTAAVGRNISISSANGLKAVDSSGDTVAHIPTSLSQDISIQADLVAKSITALGPVAMRSSLNEIAQAANLILRGATAAPVSPPTVTIEWETIDKAPSPLGANSDKGGSYHSGTNTVYFASSAFGYSSIRIHNADTGVFSSSITVGTGSSGNPIDLIAVSRYGNDIYGFILENLAWKVRRWNATTGAFVSEWIFGHDGGPFDSLFVGIPGFTINQDTGAAVIVYQDPSQAGGAGRMVRWSGNRDTGGSAAATVLTGLGLMGDVYCLYEGLADNGVSRLYVHASGFDNSFLCVDPGGATARDYDREFPTAYGEPASWLVWDSTDSRFKSQSRNTGDWHFYDSGNKWTTESSTWYVTNTWRDSDTSSGSSTHETTQGPAAVVAMKKRARLAVTTPPIPVDSNNANLDDPNSVSIYVGRVDGGRGTQWRQAAPANLIRSASISAAVFSNADTLHPNPPLASNFPNLSPALIRSEVEDGGGPLFYVGGDGLGRWKKYDDLLADTGWIEVTYINGWQSLGGLSKYALMYRRRHGIVFVRGVVVPTVNWTTAWGVLPTGFRPAVDQWRFGAYQGTADTTTVGEISDANGEIRAPLATSTRNGIAVAYLAINTSFIPDA